MTSASLALQTAVYTALTGDAALTALVDAVYDHVPEDAALPYVQIGDGSVSPFTAGGLDGEEHQLTCHVWTQAHGLTQAKQIMAAVREVLDGADLSLGGAHLVLLDFTFADILRDPEGGTQHGVLQFRALTQGL